MLFKVFSQRIASLLLLGTLLLGCTSTKTFEQKRLVIGVVSYGEGNRDLENYAGLKDYLQRSLKSFVEIEPVLNEIQATLKIERKEWDLVFAPPGLAAIAIQQFKYEPLFPRVGGNVDRSVIVVKQNSTVQKIGDLANQRVALGQSGSATGYYLPLYNLYGLTLTDVYRAPTPRAVLEQINLDKVDAGALSVSEFERYRSGFSPTQFRILFMDKHIVPPGAVLVGPTVERNWQIQITKALEETPPDISASAGFITNASLPDYNYLMKVVQRVRPLAQRLQSKPVPLY
jgi:phosphonate transport system substrate-binding protein